jgi:hypothetical protein
MRRILLSLAIGIVLSGSIFGQAVPQRLQTFLSRNYPGWTITTSFVVDQPRIPAIVNGDFNGDGRRDYAVLITKGERMYAIAAIATGRTYRGYNLLGQNRGSGNGWLGSIGIFPKGDSVSPRYDAIDPGKLIRMQNDAIQLNDGMETMQVYYWKGGKFLMGYYL